MASPAGGEGFFNRAAEHLSTIAVIRCARIVFLALTLLLLAVKAQAREPVYPLKVSEDRRYFIDPGGDPVFWLGTTQWQLVREYTIEEARTIIEKTNGHGFAFTQVMLLGVGNGTKPNVVGEKPWSRTDPLTPNEAYFKPDPAPHPTGFAHEERWLDFSRMQTWKWVEQIYPLVTQEYHLSPTKPALMAEGAYEAGSEYGFEVTPLWIRRPAYYSFLAGASPTYGHNDGWRVLPTWKQALDTPGATQLGILKQIFLDRKEWWRLTPDQTLFASGGQSNGQILNLAARHQDGWGGIVYLADKVTFSIHMDKLTGGSAVNARWVDPRTGDVKTIGRLPTSGVESFSTPEGWEDAMLILEPLS